LVKRVKRHYVNNPDFLQAIIEYKAKCDEARFKSKQLPVIPNYLGECIFHIATRLATKPNFSGYAFKEDMIMDGVENCLKYIEKFDPEKSSNPFAYFTQVIWFAFLQRIAKEKKFLYTKLKSSQSMLALGETHVGGNELTMNLKLDTDYIDNFIQDFEDKVERDKEKSRITAAKKEQDAADLEKYLEEDDEDDSGDN
jgi:hypothetical protein